MSGCARNARSKSRIAAIVLVGLFALSQTGAALGVATTATYSFVGTCGDCTGTGKGTLILQNYTLGNALNNGNLVSLSYNSNLIGFNIAGGGTAGISGALPAALPGPSASTVIISNTGTADPSYMALIVQTNGNWCAGHGCASDNGTGGAWSVGAAPPSIPTLSAPALTGLALLVALAGWILLRRSFKPATR